jgi:hypothetical protein
MFNKVVTELIEYALRRLEVLPNLSNGPSVLTISADPATSLSITWNLVERLISLHDIHNDTKLPTTILVSLHDIHNDTKLPTTILVSSVWFSRLSSVYVSKMKTSCPCLNAKMRGPRNLPCEAVALPPIAE